MIMHHSSQAHLSWRGSRPWTTVLFSSTLAVATGGACLALLLAAAQAAPMGYPGAAAGGSTMQDADTQVLSNQTLSSTTVAEDLVLNTSRVDGNLTVGRNLIANGTSIKGAATVGRDGFLNHCPKLGSLSVGRSLTLTQSRVEGSVNVGRSLQMQDSNITGDATVGGSVQLANAEVSGTLHVASSQLDLRQARLGALDLQWPATTSFRNNSFNGSSLSIQGGSIQSGSGMIVRGSRVSVTGRDNQTHISVGPDSVTTLNGMTVRGSGDQTTVITREGWVYVNGQKVSGSGPDTYAGYRVAIPSAPVIDGPGWTEGSPTADANDTPATKPEEAVLQTVTLGEGTVVRGNITFGSGQGQVKMLPGAQFTGQVVGGKLIKS